MFLTQLEQEFHSNNFGPARNAHLSVRPAGIHSACSGHGLWASTSPSDADAMDDAKRFVAEYEADVQFIFSRVQHHWHQLDKHGKRQPMQYCLPNAVGRADVARLVSQRGSSVITRVR